MNVLNLTLEPKIIISHPSIQTVTLINNLQSLGNYSLWLQSVGENVISEYPKSVP